MHLFTFDDIKFFPILGYKGAKGEESEYGHKNENGKKGGSKKKTKWGHKKGH